MPYVISPASGKQAMDEMRWVEPNTALGRAANRYERRAKAENQPLEAERRLSRRDADILAHVRDAVRRKDLVRAFNIGMHGSTAMLDALTDAELGALSEGGRRQGYR